jgi:ABC-type dipeptide/oligopeptide/nickel transport system permease subunit
MKNQLRVLCLAYVGLWVFAVICWKTFSVGASQTMEILLPPSTKHIFGTDALGRDLFGRILEGGFVSLSVSFLAAVLSLTVACIIGVIWTWYRPKSYSVLLIMDLLQAIPSYVTACLTFLLIQGLFSSSLGTAVALTSALAFTHWMNAARILRAQTHQLLASPFIEAAHALGGTHWHILKSHVPSHLRSSLLVLGALQVPILLMYESFLSFIGFGIEAPYTSWGLLLQEGWRYLSDYPHLLLGPGAVLFTVLLALNYLLDSYRYRLNLI